MVDLREVLNRLLLVSCACSTIFYAHGSISGLCAVPNPPDKVRAPFIFYSEISAVPPRNYYSSMRAACDANAAYNASLPIQNFVGAYCKEVFISLSGYFMGSIAYPNWPTSNFPNGYVETGTVVALAVCPSGYAYPSSEWDETTTPHTFVGYCTLTNAALVHSCDVNKNLGLSCPATGQPIVLGTGNKYLIETDYVGSGPFPLQITRTYNSQQNSGKFIGYGWQSSYGGVISTINSRTLTVYRPDSKVLTFNFLNNQWTPDADITDTLIQLPNATGWKYTTADDTVEIYDAAGRRTSFTNRAGLTQTYTFSDGTNSTTTGGVLLDAGGNPTNNALPPDYAIYITDQTGRKIALGYGYDTSNTIIHVVKMTDPSGGQYLYGYDTTNNLSSVSYPDGHIRQYTYNEQDKTGNTSQPHALTGITDKQDSADPGTRYASYWYDAQGRAYKEEIAPNLNQGIEKNQLVYNVDATGNPTTTIVTDALGTARTYNFTTVLGVVKSTGTNQPGGSGCAAASSGITYDANGNVSSRTDFNQHKTCYAYDLTRNLETTRAEGLTSACPANLAAWTPAANTAERKITTTWHNTYRLPLTITEPGRTTTNAYDPNSGNLLTQSIKDTATLKTRTWTYTYTVATDNTLLNLLKSIDGPRTDVPDTTTYTYYTADEAPTNPKYRKGDLKSVTDALNHTTTITSYDGNGRPLTIVDPNTVTTTLTYWPRGWLKSKAVGSKTTNYTYTPTGQLKIVTLPDTSHIDYYYDDAHRLTDIYDAHLTDTQSRIHYTLDAIGNRTQEDIFDSNNILSTTKSHTFDALSRLMTDITTYNQGTSTTLYTYDAGGNLKTLTEGQGAATPHTTTYDYDALNRLINVGDALNSISNPTSYTYDGLDQLKSVTIPQRSVNPASITTSYTLNALGEATQETSPDSGVTNRTYDTAGNLKTATDARGIQATYTWDALNRLTSITYPTTGENIAYTWDSTPGCTYGIGRLCKITDAEGSTTYSYDDQGNLSQQTRQIAGVNYTTGYSYDGANRLLTTTTPSGETQTLTRNSAGRINTLDTSNGITTTHLAKDIAYNGTGQVTAQTLGNGIQQNNSYDLAGLPATRRNNAPDGDLNGDGIVDVADVALAERMALGLVTPTADQLVHGDVAPSITPDGSIDAADVARIRRKALGLESF